MKSEECSERDIQRAVMEWASVALPRCVRVQSGNFRARGSIVHGAQAGTPDLLGFCEHGRIVAFEVKREGAKMTTEQENWIATVVRHGGIAGVVRSVEDAARVLSDGCERHG